MNHLRHTHSIGVRRYVTTAGVSLTTGSSSESALIVL